MKCCDTCGGLNSLSIVGSHTLCRTCESRQRGTPKTLTEAIDNGVKDGLGKTHLEFVIAIELAVRDYLANKAFSKDIELDRAFKIFFDKVCNKTVSDLLKKGA